MRLGAHTDKTPPTLYLGIRWWIARFTLRPLCFQRKSSRAHWIVGWNDPRPGLDWEHPAPDEIRTKVFERITVIFMMQLSTCPSEFKASWLRRVQYWYHNVLYYLSTALQPFVGPRPLFSFLILYTAGRAPWTGHQPVAKPLPIHRTTQTHNKPTETSMPRVGFEATTPVFERAKTVHALDCSATVIGYCFSQAY
jgi:hypothetical protein